MVRPEFPHLATASHRCFVGSAGVTLYSTEQLEEDDQDPAADQLMLLSPGEALQLAEYILAHRAELESRERALEAQFEQVSQALLSLFTERWRRELFEERRQRASYTPGFLDFDQALADAYRQLVLDESGEVRQWYKATFTDRFSHEQQEALFWRYFNRRYREGLLEQFFPEDEEGEEEETEDK
jgi:hypothetical protein